MPKRSSSQNDADEVTAAFHTMQDVIASHDPGSLVEGRVRELERLCDEVLQFARLAELPERVIVALENAAKGRSIGPTLLPITPTDFPKESPAVALGRAGGLKGGKARAESLSSRRRKEIATRAATARWNPKAK